MITRAWDPVHDARAAFRAGLEAMCRPGRPVAGLPRAGLAADPLLDHAAALLLALLDPGVGLAVSGDAATRYVGDALLRETGADPAPVGDADFVLAGAGAQGVAGRARHGSALRPHEGATIVYAADHPPVRRRQRGPGFEAPEEVALPLLPGELELLAAAAANPPAGVDAFVVAADGLIALPRSVLEAAA